MGKVTGQGNYNVICPVCGWKYKASEMKKRWDGLMVCETDWESRHPMDFFRTIPDQKHLPFVLPDLEDDPSSEWGYANFSGAASQRCLCSFTGNELKFKGPTYYYPITVEFWINQPSLNTTKTILHHGDGVLIATDITGQVIIYIGNGVGSSNSRLFIFAVPIPVGAWTKVEFIVSSPSGGQLYYYDLNNTLLTTQAVGSSVQTYPWNIPAITVGTATDGTGPFIGGIDELRIWQVVRSAQQLSKYRFKELTGGEQGLLVYLNFNAKTIYGWNNLVAGSPYRADRGFKITPASVSFQTNTFMRP